MVKDRRRPDGPETSDQLRDKIDRGGTGDKVAFSDPSAAPLGTDDEAAGHPPSRAQVRHAAAAETGRAEAADSKKEPAELQSSRRGTGVIAVAVGVILATLLVMLFA
ncbi:MAG: hypothetical protein ACU0DK_09565 [Pseudooceanicola sp.]